MLSSKQILDITEISRATLNNYISLGLLSKPKVLNPGVGADGPRQLGFFPDNSIDRIREIQRLKREGISMSEIVARMAIQEAAESAGRQHLATSTANAATHANLATPSAAPPENRTTQAQPRADQASASGLRVTIEDIAHPAYMVNHNLELIWFNDAAKRNIFCGLDKLPPTSEGRGLFRLLAASGIEPRTAELLNFHVKLAKDRMSPARFAECCHGLPPATFAQLQQTYVEIDAVPHRPIIDADLQVNAAMQRTYASLFREGILIVLTPQEDTQGSMLDFLAHRDEVIRSLLQRRMPVLTNLAVMVADLQSSVRICSELPPDEYFALINEIWAVMGPIFRKYHGARGKHVGDGMVYYFFPQPDSDYLSNALACAIEMREEMKRLSKHWQLKKNWLNELYLNTGITEGQEWLGTFRTDTSIEFVVLGDTINQAARISDFARFGSIWATKSLVGKLSQETRERLNYGVRRVADGGREVFVPASFGMVTSLVPASGDANSKLRDIATLPIAEIIDIAEPRPPLAIG